MIALLDVHVLVALFDPSHLHHEVAHAWFGANRGSGWATCPTTENGLVRVVSHPAYPGRRITVAGALERLRAFAESGDHHFWASATSLRRESRIHAGLLQGHEQITGTYLLLLAVQHEGRLATFDRDIPVEAILRAAPQQLVVLG